MKKMKIYLSVAAATLLLSGSVYAAIITQTNTKVTVNGTNSPGPDLVFSASNNVQFGGACAATSFFYSSYHTGVDQKASGKQFAMAANSTKVWWKDISGTAVSTFTATNTDISAISSDSNWNSN